MLTFDELVVELSKLSGFQERMNHGLGLPNGLRTVFVSTVQSHSQCVPVCCKILVVVAAPQGFALVDGKSQLVQLQFDLFQCRIGIPRNGFIAGE